MGRRSEKGAATELDLSKLVNALPVPIWTTHGDGNCDFANHHWCDYTGLRPDEARDLGWQSAIHPDDLPTFIDCWSVIRQSAVDGEIDARLRRFDGEYRWFAFHPSLMKDASGGGRWCWLALYADESTSTDGRLRRLFDMLPVQAGFLSTTAVLEFTNLQSLKDFGMTQDELRQWASSGIIHADDHEQNYRNISALLRTGERMDQQLRMLYPDGNYRWTRARCVPVHDAQGNVVRYVTCQIDVDDLKRAEDLLAAEVKVLERVARGEPLEQILDALRRRVEELCGECCCTIFFDTPDRQRCEVGANSTLPGGDPCSISPIAKAPITTGSGSGDPVGVIAIFRREPGNPTAREKDLIDRFARIAGIAIERARTDAALRSSEAEQRRVNMQLLDAHRLSRTGSFTWDVPADNHVWTEEIFQIGRAHV